MAVFNKAEVLEELGDDVEFLKELSELFIDGLPEQMDDIKKAISINDNVLLNKAAHKLKGGAGNFGKNAVYETAFRLETIGKEGNMDEAMEVYSVLEKEVEQLVNELNAI